PVALRAHSSSPPRGGGGAGSAPPPPPRARARDPKRAPPPPAGAHRRACGARVYRDLAPAVLAGAGDRDLKRCSSGLGEDQRRLQGELLDGGGLDFLSSTQRQLEEGRAGQKD